jgi:hypothetical protein
LAEVDVVTLAKDARTKASHNALKVAAVHVEEKLGKRHLKRGVTPDDIS